MISKGLNRTWDIESYLEARAKNIEKLPDGCSKIKTNRKDAMEGRKDIRNARVFNK